MSKITNFIRYWSEHGYEKGEKDSFWIDFLESVLDISNWKEHVSFETHVPRGFIDAYFKDTRVIVEQKGSNVQLDDAVFEQAKRYNDELNFSRKARYIITCNFREFQIYDMDKSKPATSPFKISLAELAENPHAFDFIVKRRRNFELDKKLSFDTAAAVGKIYDEILKSAKIKKIDEGTLKLFRNLNKLCVRLVFCFYAERADIFPQHKMFSDYLENETNIRRALLALFKVLNTPPQNRSPYDDLNKFPYIDGGLFDDDETFDFPDIHSGTREILKNLKSYKWQEINPTIFGAVFESTLNQDNLKKNIRREEGIHYTAPANIEKVINPLFMQNLYDKFAAATSRDDLFNLQNEIAALKFLDPACGSGNFLTETYLLLRELENSILEVLVADGVKFTENPIKISIENFYGIEINDFAVAVAKTALWISEIQMRKKTAEIVNLPLKHFPLEKIPNIICANALTFDWKNLIAPANLNFIIGNPPFIGKNGQTPAQKAEVLAICEDYKPLDYVCCWYKKASDFIAGTKIRCAFVSTNSICQGEQVAPFWKHLKFHIDFAYKTFIWDSDAEDKAKVHIIIIGFSQVKNLPKFIFEVKFEKDKDGKKIEKIYSTPAQNINGYLIDAPNVYVESRTSPLCNVSNMFAGNRPTCNGNLLLSEDDRTAIIKKYPDAEKFIKICVGGREFLHNEKKYCLWLVDATPNEIKKIPPIYERVKNVREYRLKSTAAKTRKDSEISHLFQKNVQPSETFLFIPQLSSENRRYIPIGLLSPEIIPIDPNFVLPNAGLYEFGILTSSVHMAWMKTVCGRLEMRYRYSASIVYNNFVWCTPTPEQRAAIERTAQAILEARAKFPNSSLADLYDETTMPPELRRAHRANDAAVMAAYGFSQNMTEAEIVGELFKKYLQLTK